ncbi:MAG: hypothetical protein J1F64_06525 [Oscillospiraceae bacterium]|nr:hypothetical protein [Oscillospiraceae bacterium]
MKKVIFVLGVVMGIMSMVAVILGLTKIGFLEKSSPFKKKPAARDEVYSETD